MGVFEVRQGDQAPMIDGVPLTPSAEDFNALDGKAATIAAFAALAAAGLGASASYAKTTDGAQTLLAANATSEGDRVVLIIVHVDEAFADAGGTQTTFSVGETGTADKFAATSVFTDATLGSVFVLAGTLSEEAALLVTANDAAGAGTGGITATVLALPAAA